MKKTILFSFAYFLLLAYTHAQSVGIGTSTPDASALLDVKSSSKGMLVPRTSTISRVAIINPAKGLIVYDTAINSLWFYNGAVWAAVGSSGSSGTGWAIAGNSGTNPAQNFIGTTDEKSLRFRTNNLWAGEIHPTNGNIFLGIGAGELNTTGEANTSFGEQSLHANTEGNFNVSNGYYALTVNSTGYNNTALGAYALSSNTTGYSNTAIGRNALFANNSGYENTATGKDALLSNTTGYGNSAYGFRALSLNHSSNNTALGNNALYLNTDGLSNTATGSNALSQNVTGNSNTATGAFSLLSNTIGENNTSVGSNSIQNNTTGNRNTAIGSSSLLSNITGNQNTALGYRALSSNENGDNNTATGFSALNLSSEGGSNTSMGSYSSTNNTTGNNNTALGSNSLYRNQTGSTNTAIGSNALENNISGNNNIALGGYSGTGINAGALFNTIGIGNTDGFLNGASNQTIIGNTSMVFIGGKVTWSTVSDGRIKNTIQEDVKGLDFILRLRPVTYHISNKAIDEITGAKESADFPGKNDGEKVKYTGFIAQEVEQAAKAANFEFSGYMKPRSEQGLYTVSYEQFVVPLVKAVQEQEATIVKLQKKLELLEKKMEALESKNN